MSLLTFPRSLVRTGQWSPPELIGGVKTAGRTPSGLIANSRTDGGGLWSTGFDPVLFTDLDDIRALEALKAILESGVTPITFPVEAIGSLGPQPWPTINGVRVTSYGDVPHSDDTLFSDDAGYDQSVIVVSTAVDAELRDTSLQLSIVSCGPLRGGELFSIEHDTMSDRMYRIIGVDAQDDTSATVRFRPPLREDTSAGTAVEFDSPRCLMQIDGSSGFTISKIPPYFANVGIQLVESFLPVDNG